MLNLKPKDENGEQANTERPCNFIQMTTSMASLTMRQTTASISIDPFALRFPSVGLTKGDRPLVESSVSPGRTRLFSPNNDTVMVEVTSVARVSIERTNHEHAREQSPLGKN
jgi:hypothetical protein